MICESQARGITQKTTKTETVTDICCPHQKDSDKQKFRLTFENSSIDSMDDCGKQTKYKCMAFWNFIDSDPEMSSLVKEGHFIHKNDPTKVIYKDKAQRNKELDTGIKIGGMNKVEFKAMYDEYRERLQKRREFNFSVELKSKQLPFSRNPRIKEEPKPEVEFADSCMETLDETIREMNKFDENV